MRHVLIGFAAFAAAFSIVPVDAQSVEEFYKGRNITLNISASPGGSYDAYGRLLARNIGRHIPGQPNVVASNMPGAGGRNVANHMYNVAPRDGTVMAIMHHSTIYDALFEEPGIRYDGRNFNWIGSLDIYTGIGFAWAASGVTTVEEARGREISMGSTGRGSMTYKYPALMNELVGTKFRIVAGYQGSTEIYLAIEQGEMHGMMGVPWPQLRDRYSHWLKEGKANVFVQFAMEKHPELPDVPLILDLAQSAEDRRAMEFIFGGHSFSRPFLVPPDVPKDRIAALRAAFDAMVKDPEFLADAKRVKMEIRALSGEEVQRIVANVYNAPPDVVKRAAEAMR